MDPAPVTLRQDPFELTAKVTIEGTATGRLMGGNLEMIGTSVGLGVPDFLRSERLSGVAIGQFIRSGEPKPGKWSVVDVLQDQLSRLGLPVLGGLPVGHGPHPPTIPLGTMATLDTTARTLTVEPGVR